MSEFLRRAHYLLSETDPARLEPARAEVAFIGRSNVGKSSLLNALCQRHGLANVSKTPGRTRAINIFAVDHLRWLVDLPGYGFAVGPTASREKWSAMIEGYLTSRQSLRCVFLLIDSKVGPTVLDHQMREWLNAESLPHRFLANKIDQVKPSQRASQQKAIAQVLETTVSEIHWVSATEQSGLAPVRQEVVKFLEWKPEKL
jgi:GTP-binding protein